MVRPPRLERGTPGLEGRCSIQLSYGRLSGYLTKTPEVRGGNACDPHLMMLHPEHL